MSCSIITIIPLFLFILLSGAVLIYLNFKIIDIKREVDKQNKILLSFISDLKSNFVNKQEPKFNCAYKGGDGSLASDGALAFVNKIVECDLTCGMPTFAVSANDLVCNSHKMNDLETFNLEESSSDESSDDDDDTVNLVIEVSDVELPVSETVSLPNIGVVDISDVELILDTNTNTNTNTNTDTDIPSTDLGNMKVEQLRKVVLEKGLAPSKEVNKMKKHELLAVMSRNK